MTRPKQHHYLPESYQYQFVDSDNRIHFLDKISGRVQKTIPKSFGKEKDLYTLEKPPEGKQPTYIENPTLSGVDGNYPELVKKLEGEDFSALDKRNLARYLGYLRNRTPSYFKLIEQVSQEVSLKDIYQEVVLDDEKLKLYQNEALFDMSSEEAFVEQAINHIGTDKDHILNTFLRSSPEFAELIDCCDWDVMISRSIPFISSDKAFAKAEDELFFVDQGRTIYKRYFLIPLSSSICLRLSGDNSRLSKRIVADEEILDVNECISYCAERWIIGSSEEVLLNSHNASKALLAEEAVNDVISMLTRDEV
ncbi:DUF4238 domain-containing protein [Halomonas sp. SpR1]|uniref:DUF4238 domain-containing protein n=1 Tax=Halomonas sp. SpR1 TaxID=3050462 RepID=UPI0027E56FF8|nr:DUF4238 domain-containing protein [Halomonas sp. SpR1]MDQ7733649.1 DUF4238 domain-containing protein [Halomonas sp. SpR1]